MQLPDTRSTTFRLIRIITFSIATLASLAWAAIYALLLIRGWSSYGDDQRTLTIIMFAIYALSSISLYLLIITKFRLWLDGLRVALMLSFQTTGTVFFELFRPSLPCSGLDSGNTCEIVESIAVYGGWCLSALLLAYAFLLVALAYHPEKLENLNPPPYSPRSSRSPSTWSDDAKLKRMSLGSTGSGEHSRVSSLDSYKIAVVTPPPSAHPNTRSPRMPMAYNPSEPPTPSTLPLRFLSPAPGTPRMISAPSSPYAYPPRSMTPAPFRTGTPGWVTANTILRPPTAASSSSSMLTVRNGLLPVPSTPRPTIPPGLLFDPPPRQRNTPSPEPIPSAPANSSPPSSGLKRAPSSLPNPFGPPTPTAVSPFDEVEVAQQDSSSTPIASPTTRRAYGPTISTFASQRKGIRSSVPRSPSDDGSDDSETLLDTPQAALLPAHPPLRPTTPWGKRLNESSPR